MPVRRLWLLRHAKSSWDDPGVDDHDRPLSDRGRRAGAAMASHCDRTGVRPELVLCSSAVRARETLAAVLPGLGSALRVSVEDELYTFEARALLDRLRRVEDEVGSVLLVGHNPAIEGLATRLAADGEDLHRLRSKYPTAGLATIDLDVEAWSDVAAGCGHLDAFVIPADLSTWSTSPAPTVGHVGAIRASGRRWFVQARGVPAGGTGHSTRLATRHSLASIVEEGGSDS